MSGPPAPPANLVQTRASADDPVLAHIIFRMASDWAYASTQYPHYIQKEDVDMMKDLLGRVERRAGGEGASTPGGPPGGEMVRVTPGGQTSGGQTPRPTTPNPPPRPEVLRAIWGYNGGQPDDLAFPPGAEITLVERVNPDWWRGQFQGRVGLFPSNHVESSRDSLAAPPPHYQSLQPEGSHYGSYQGQLGGPPFSGGPPSQDYKYTSQGPPSPNPQWQQPQQPQQQLQQVPQQQQQQQQPQQPRPQPMETHGITATLNGTESKKSKFGKQFGTTVANGFAWGVGMDLAGELVHKMF